ncbi:retinoic acid receptor responder protein 1 [Acinonyx jubatus]|uniref:Retinoic acid receptor responder protein 1 n=1 Tax=Acinonyx jubatus TaxID=32536 RepID=A0A6J1ZNJ9_ACIJB|nr:retinoic acid receptor responder protein 1 [Acinonyx jubatus]
MTHPNRGLSLHLNHPHPRNDQGVKVLLTTYSLLSSPSFLKTCPSSNVTVPQGPPSMLAASLPLLSTAPNFTVCETEVPSLGELKQVLKPEGFRNRSNCRGEKPAHGLGWGRGAGAAGAGHLRPRAAEAPPRPGIEPESWGPGGVGRGGGAQGLEAAPRGRGRARTRAPGSGPPRGRRGVARRGLISSSAGAAHLEPVRRTPRSPASMPPRLQPPLASGTGRPRAAVLPLALLLSLALQGVAAAPAGAGEPEDSLRRRDPELPRGLLEQAARVALHFVNFRAGSPSTLRVLADVLEGRARVNPKKECQVDLVFTTDRYNPEEGEERLGKCSARVFFRNQKPRPAINVTCTRLIEKNKRQQEDYLLYKHMKQLKTPLDVVSIPDSHGHIDPSLRPIWDLAFLGGSYVMWEKTTQFLHYYMAQLSSVNQWKTNDDAIDFDYTVLLHEFSTQEIIPCRIHLVWYPGKPLKVKYHCQELQTPEEASGTEEGSAVAPTELNNF